MTRTSIIAAVALTLGLAACNGPNEKAGAAQDEAAANAAGVAYNGNGPAEAAGKAADHVDRAVAKARNEQADALKDQGRAISSQADADADKLEEQAKAIRGAAKDKVRTLDQQAKTVRQH
ncbi:MAG: hypothetical protein EOO77_00560 [Oxalobacteraceae bacterium]|nr:MAG: hypothetical protein EOO77_00560 [Oxalobacteraceae bacterium]